MAKIDYALITFDDSKTNADVDQYNPNGSPPNPGTALEVEQFIDATLLPQTVIKTTADAGAYDDGTYVTQPGVIDFGSQQWLADRSRPKEKVNVEGAVQAFGFIDRNGDDLTELLAELLPRAPRLSTLDSQTGVTGIVGTQNATNAVINQVITVQGKTTTPNASRGILGAGTDVSGALNFNVQNTNVHAADAFGPGDEGILRLFVNGSPAGTDIDLTDLTATDATGGGSITGLTVSAAFNVTFPSGASFDSGFQRTGSWRVVEADLLSDDVTTIRVAHIVGGTEIASTNTLEYFKDTDTQSISITTGTPSGWAGSPALSAQRKDLSGVSFARGATANLRAQVDNVYRTTYSPVADAIFYTNKQNVAIEDASIPSAASVTDSVVLSNQVVSGGNNVPLASYQGTAGDQAPAGGPQRFVEEPMELRVNVRDTIEPVVTSSLLTTNFTLLVDNIMSQPNEDLRNDFILENRRAVGNNVNWANVGASGINATWDSTQLILDTSSGGAGYTNGLQVIGGRLEYPSRNLTDDLPAGNPNYTGSNITGEREYVGYFTDTDNAGDFAFRIQGSGTLTEKGSLTTGTDQVAIEIRVGGMSQWYDLAIDVSQGGAYAQANGASQSFNNQPIGITTGGIGPGFFTATAAADDRLYYRITYPENGTAVLTKISVDWLA